MTCQDVFQHLVDEIYRVLKKDVIKDQSVIIKIKNFDKDVPGVDKPNFKVVFNIFTKEFGDSYGGIVLCGSIKDRSENPRAQMSVSVVVINDLMYPKNAHRVLIDGFMVDNSQMSMDMASALLQYVFVDYFFGCTK